MTVPQALARLQALDASAAAGWPEGYDAGRVRAEARAAVAVLAQAVDDASPRWRAATVRRFVRALTDRQVVE